MHHNFCLSRRNHLNFFLKESLSKILHDCRVSSYEVELKENGRWRRRGGQISSLTSDPMCSLPDVSRGTNCRNLRDVKWVFRPVRYRSPCLDLFWRRRFDNSRFCKGRGRKEKGSTKVAQIKCFLDMWF